MSWNEPGDDGKDPWSGRDGQQKGPPDLDEALRNLQEKFNGLFGGGNGGGMEDGGSMKGLGLVAAVAVLFWLASGFYIVDEGWRGVETRFGKFTTVTQPGWQWRLPAPIEQVQMVNIGKLNSLNIGEAGATGFRQFSSGGNSGGNDNQMLTTDENYVDVRLNVQYQIQDPYKYLFKVERPDDTLRQVTESVERGVIGKSEMDYILTEGRGAIASEIKTEVQEIMDSYDSGIRVTNVTMQNAQAPEEVQGAFKDVIKAREDKQRLINEAEAYSNDVVPKAGGAAARKVQEAEAYKARVVAEAEGDVSRFSQLFAEYKKAPEVTRKRIYLEAIESVLQNADTVLLDVKGGNNVVYLPLDRSTQSPSNSNETADAAAGGGSVGGGSAQPNHVQSQTSPPSLRTVERGREPRGRY